MRRRRFDRLSFPGTLLHVAAAEAGTADLRAKKEQGIGSAFCFIGTLPRCVRASEKPLLNEANTGGIDVRTREGMRGIARDI
jgi:hypothetical protein